MSEEQKKEQSTQSKPMTEKEREDRRRKRDIEYRKRIQAIKQATTPEEREAIYNSVHSKHVAHQKKVELKPTTFKEKWANYWYHYKAMTFCILAIAALVILFVHDMLTKDKFDLEIMAITTSANANYSYEGVEETLTQYVEDVNKDDKKRVLIDPITLDDNPNGMEDANYRMAAVVKYQASVSEVYHIVYILDQVQYDDLKELGATFVDLSDYSDNSNVDGDKYYIKDDSDFESLPNRENLMLVVRDIQNSSKRNHKKTQEIYQRDLEVVKKIIAE